jgi:superfamily II DNA or RNA helicase/HKD family nuclease
MPPLPRGLYERLLTDLLAERLEEPGAMGDPELTELRRAEAADRIALHLAGVVERALDALPESERVSVGIELARRVIEQVVADTKVGALAAERPVVPARALRAVRGRLPDGRAEAIDLPLIPLLDTTLLTNAPGEPRVGRQIQAEIASADRIDVVMAFIRRSGIAPLREALRRHVDAGRALRVLTTTYTGSTEAEALELLLGLGAHVRVSYDTGGTRLHAKAWLFHRDSGYSTAYVGSSNLTHSAQVSGLEWNVRVSAARNRPVIEKIAAVFESYWRHPDFAAYEPERFAAATRGSHRDEAGLTLSPIEIRLEPFQERLLEQIELARRQGRHRNLLVSATGTGKTVMAAVDYARLRGRLGRARLLFVAHREEILAQSRATFAHALRDASFGEPWVGGRRPRDFEHVFASIQSLAANGLGSLDPTHFDVVVVDEFHHAAAASYARLLEALRPVELLGLTATPERSDGLPVLHWFDDRIAAELRLWDAIDQHRLVPFAYYGIADDLDLREIPWRRGTGYDVERLTGVITATDVWARRVLAQLREHVGRTDGVRALGFCVSVDHARYMARVFAEHGVRAAAVWAETPEEERRRALEDLAAARINVVFSVDLFNEGVDVPAVDALLMLRPTDSPVLFLQQLGRGLRKSPGKTVCTVLDFVGRHRTEFRYDRRFQTLLGGSRASVMRQVAEGFPFLPAGCHMELDRVASERVLESIRHAVPTRWAEKAAELRRLAAEEPGLTLGTFLRASGLDLDDIYAQDRSWSDLREAAGIVGGAAGPHEEALRRACARLLHVDDPERLDAWREWLRRDDAPDIPSLATRERRLLRMLLVQLLDRVASAETTLREGARLLWRHPGVRAELIELFDVLAERIPHVPIALDALPDVPLVVHGRYTRLEVLAACAADGKVRVRPWREGVYHDRSLNADLFVFTLDKTSGQFSPTTRYRDYAISRELIHWESQSGTRADSPTGRRYQRHESLGGHILLFARLSTAERAFHFLGPASYVSHVGESPMAVTWRLHHPLPGDLFQQFAAAVA